MALIKCNECGKEISSEIKFCLHYGAKINNSSNKEVNKSPINSFYIWSVIFLPIICCFLFWAIEYFTNSFLISIFPTLVFNIILEIFFILKDYRVLKATEIDTSSLGIVKATSINIPKYIIKRAKLLNESILKFIIWLIGFIFFILIILLEFNPFNSYNKYIDEVKEGRLYLCDNYTVEALINEYVENPKWKVEKTKDGNIAVNISGEITYLDKPAKALIQFYIDDQEFKFNAFEINGILQTDVIFYAFIESMCNSMLEENTKNAIVTFDNGLIIEEEEFYNEVKESSKNAFDVLINKIDCIIYENEFPNEINNAKDYAKEYIKNVKSYYGSEYEYLEALKSYGYKSEKDLEDYTYTAYLQNYAVKTYIKSSLTSQELKDYYDNKVFPDMALYHILAFSKEEATNILKELDYAKENGSDVLESFKKIAKEKTQDSTNKSEGGYLGIVNNEFFSSNNIELFIEAGKIKDGEYSSNIIKTEYGYHIIFKSATYSKKSYEDSLPFIKESLAEEKINNKSNLIYEIIEHYYNKYNPKILDQELNIKYQNYFKELKDKFL